MNFTSLSPCCGQDPAEAICQQPAAHPHLHEQESACHCCHDHAAPEEFDPALFQESSATRAVYRIVNMDCPMEEALIRTKLGAMNGIVELEFNLMQRVLVVEHRLPSTKNIEAALSSIGMTPEPVETMRGAVAGEAADSLAPVPAIPWGRLAIGGVAAAFAEALHFMQAWPADSMAGSLQAWQLGGLDLFSAFSLACALIAIASTGLGTYKKGWIAVRNRNLNINALMSVAVTGAFIIGQYPEAAMVMVLFNLSEAIESLALDRARNAIKKLLALAPEQATVLRADGSWCELDIREVGLGSRVRVKPGERVALDGVVVQGRSAVNQAPITGESMPVEKEAGDPVYAGTINESGSFEFKVTAVAADTTLARIIHAVEEAQGRRAPIQRLVDRFARYYTPAVFVCAILAGVVPPLFLNGDWIASLYTALVLLVIGCPCALVISTPVSIVSAMAAAARQGILIKGGMFLEQGRRLTCLALDKTGTITSGRPRQTDCLSLGTLDAESAAILAASLAVRSDHPVSLAIGEEARTQGLALLPVEDFMAIPGRGVQGTIDGAGWALGNMRMVRDLGRQSSELEERIISFEQEGKSVVALVGPQGVQALFAVADTAKASSIEAVRALKKLGVSTVMLTGDNEHAARHIATQVGVDAYEGNLLPEEKLEAIARLGQSGVVGMVGDGINDAPALARADIGFAMAAGGTDTAIETADVALMDDDLRKIPRFISLSKSTYAILMQNIGFAIGVKVLFFILAFMGLASMWMAVFADVGTSLLVVANGLRTMRT